MKTYIENLFLLPTLIAGLSLVPAGRVTAQTFTTLHSFGGYPDDGASPLGGVILSGNTLYGTTEQGGNSDVGTVFKVNADGTAFTNLYTFTALISGTNSDGASPLGGVILSGNTLYGTTELGGNSGAGTVFKVNVDGTAFSNLYTFTAFVSGTNSDGAAPQAGVILSGNTLYGTAFFGGNSGGGTVFKVNTDGTGFTNLHTFEGGSNTALPYAGLILSGNTLYGTTLYAGLPPNGGAVFKLNTDGTGFMNLHTFTVSDGSNFAEPYAGLILSGNTLYGTESRDGNSLNGTVFKVNTDGTAFTILYSFSGGSDGASPHAGLILSGNTLYGTASGGGSSGYGTVFAVKTDGQGFTTLHSFTGGSDGASPLAGLVLSGNTLYGTTREGGSSGNGTVFSLSFAPPQLTIKASDANVILTWPTDAAGFDYAGFTLQSTTNLVSPAVWSTVSPGPVVFNGQNTVTNPISGPREFYRLSQ